ncbi:MAG: peptide ABC transporter substrate-binding protein [Anaerolineae bacterium]|nr:peptide ABC transporter substrate-binding protein [Anaerolineae bacterium]
MTRHIRWQILLILLGVVLVGILLAYLAINYTTVLRPGYGGTYVEGIAGFPHRLNPLLSGYDDVERDVCALLFSGLTRMNASGEVEPNLAQWDPPSPDGLTYIFRLRQDARWHDGTPVTADDVIFTIGLLQDPKFPGPPEMGANVWRTVKVEKISNLAVRFTLAEPYAPFLDYTTFGLLPEHLLEGTRAANLLTEPFNLQPVGNGPFQLEEIEVEEGTITSMVLKPSTHYYGPQPHLGRIQLRFYPTHQAAINAYEAGEVEGIAQIPATDLPRAKALPTLNLFSAQTAEYGIVILNLNRDDLPFFQETEVRQALLYALDRQRIVDQVLAGQALVTHGPLLPDNWAHDDGIRHYEHDPEKASALLEEADWKLPYASATTRRKDGTLLSFTLLTSSEPERVGVAEMLAEQWAPIGATVTVEAASPAEVREALETRNFDAILIHIAAPGDPDPYPFWHQEQIENGQNYAGFNHRHMSEIIEQARVTVNPERRRQLYDEFQEIFAQEVPSIPLYVPTYTYGVDERIHDVQIGPLVYPSDRFRTIAAWWIVPRRVFVSEAEAGLP